MGYTGVCAPNEFGFSAVLVVNIIMAILVVTKVRVLLSSLKLKFLEEALLPLSIRHSINNIPAYIMFRASVQAATIINELPKSGGYRRF